jgi:hypothetical protein
VAASCGQGNFASSRFRIGDRTAKDSEVNSINCFLSLVLLYIELIWRKQEMLK